MGWIFFFRDRNILSPQDQRGCRSGLLSTVDKVGKQRREFNFEKGLLSVDKQDPIPKEYNRNAMVHTGSSGQYTIVNCMNVLLLATNL